MGIVTITPFDQALEFIELLPPEDQEAVVEIVQQRLVEQRRSEIAANARVTLQSLREGHVQYGTVNDLRRDLLGKP